MKKGKKENKIMANFNIEVFKWTSSATELLMRLIKSHYEQLKTGVKKSTYQEIADTINLELGTDLTYGQIDSKWKGLKRTYKKIKEYTYSTGRTRPWVHYAQVEEILSLYSELEPLPDVLSTENIQDSDESALEFVSTNNEVESEPEFKSDYQPSRKRKRYVEIDDREDAIERRHRERIEVANRFNDIFEEMVRKM